MLTFMRYTDKGNIREYIMAMRDIAGKLNDLNITISDSFLVHFILQTLSPEYDLLRSPTTHIRMNGQ